MGYSLLKTIFDFLSDFVDLVLITNEILFLMLFSLASSSDFYLGTSFLNFDKSQFLDLWFHC